MKHLSFIFNFNNMKRFIKSFIFFSGFASIMYLALLFFWGSKFIPAALKPNIKYPYSSSGFTYTRLQEVKNTSNVDILIIGSSHSYRGIDNRHFENKGLKVFNLGTNAQTPLQTLVLVKKYLEPLNPKLVIFDVFPGVFANDGTESGLDIISNDKNDINSFWMSIKTNNPKVFNTLLYKTLIDLININTDHNTDLNTDIDKYIKGGYVERKITNFKTTPTPKGRWVLKQKQLHAFEKVITYLKSKSKKFILVNTPVTTLYYKLFFNSAEFDSIMNKTGEYYNFNTLIKLNDSLHFMDRSHLNQRGAEIFTDSLISILERNNKIP